jgi:hypothetical protein
VAATLDNGTSPSITGNYAPRTAASYAAGGAINQNIVVITNTAAVGLIKKGDNIYATGPNATYVVNNVSGDGLTLTLASNIATAPVTAIILGSVSGGNTEAV